MSEDKNFQEKLTVAKIDCSDCSGRESYHFIAIGGIGMSALASILHDKGFRVSGSDEKRSAITEQLSIKGIAVSIGYGVEPIPEDATVVFSTAVREDNLEMVEVKRRNLKRIHRSEMLGELLQGKKGLLVAGSHGKTTTSSLLAHVLSVNGLAPSYAIGGIPRSLGTNGRHGEGEYFVAEACESDGSFLNYVGFGAIVTNIDGDHLDYWKDEKSLALGFKSFMDAIISKEHLVFCIDDPWLSNKDIRPVGISYGFSEKADARILRFSQTLFSLEFDCLFRGVLFSRIVVPLIGTHNVLNAAAVFILGLQLGIAEIDLRASFTSFSGVSRRVEKKGERNGIIVFDDYGHHPTEIKTTLEALKIAGGGRRIVVAFQPHRYSRTRDCLDGFAEALLVADVVVLTDIYGAGEDPILGVSTQVLLRELQVARREWVFYSPRSELVFFLRQLVHRGDFLLTLGAGDITSVGPLFLGDSEK